MIKLGVFFGGKSVEHEISVITMSQAISSLNPDKYEIVPIYITKEGVMYTGDDLLDLYQYKDNLLSDIFILLLGIFKSMYFYYINSS